MKLFRICFCLISFTLLMPMLYGQVTPQQIGASLPGKPEHPYLLFDKAGKAEILSRISADQDLQEIYDRLIVEANRWLYTAAEEFPPQPSHPRYSADDRFDRQMNEYCRASFSLAFLYQMTGEPRYAAKAFEFAAALAELPVWILKAHDFTIIYDRVWPWNALLNDDNVVFSFDIRTASTSIYMALVYDWCYDAFGKKERDKLRNALYEKVILPVRHNYDYQWWATSYKCNWCGICFSGLGVAALALLTEDPSLTDVAAEAYNRITTHLGYLGPDGAWQEGRSYWAYGMSETIYFMEAMRVVTGGKYNLFNHERIRQAPVDFALYGLTGDFGDGSGKPVGHTFVVNKLVEQTGNAEGAWYRNHFLGAGGSIQDILWPRPTVEERAPQNPSRHFTSIDWAFMRSGFTDPNLVTVACKAGYNDDPHHGHLDVGQFMVYWQNSFFIKDLGNIDYDEPYFTNDRWNYANVASIGHNVIHVNGEQQLSAKMKDTPWKEGVGGKILEFRSSPEQDYVRMDPSGAYPGKELKQWRRHIVLRKPQVTLVVDEVTCDPGASVEARFFPGVPGLEVGEREILLTGEEGDVMALIPLCLQEVTTGQGRLPFLPVKKEAKVTWISFFTATVKSERPVTVLASLIVPVKDRADAGKISKGLRMTSTAGGGYQISFPWQNRRINFNFRNTPDGLVLQ